MDAFAIKNELFTLVLSNEPLLMKIEEELKTLGQEELALRLNKLQQDIAIEEFNNAFEDAPVSGVSAQTDITPVVENIKDADLDETHISPDSFGKYEPVTYARFEVVKDVALSLKQGGSRFELDFLSIYHRCITIMAKAASAQPSSPAPRL